MKNSYVVRIITDFGLLKQQGTRFTSLMETLCLLDLAESNAEEESMNLALLLTSAAACIVVSVVVAYLSLRCWRIKKQRQQQDFSLRCNSGRDGQGCEYSFTFSN